MVDLKILLVEDSERLRDALTTAFRKEGFLVDNTGDGSEGLWFGLHHPYDVIVLDIMLPGMDGLSILQQWRDSHIHSPVLLLTAKDRVMDRVEGLRTGADDYLVKPFAIEELLERVRVLARRGERPYAELISIGSLTVDIRQRQASLSDKVLPLTPKEYRLLELLCRNPGQVLSRSVIEERIYDSLAEPLSNVVDVTVSSLRRKLRAAGGTPMIQTRRGHGYLVESAS